MGLHQGIHIAKSGMPTTTHRKDERKESTIRVRVTAEQKDFLRAAAELDGLELSAWLRQLGLQAARKLLR